MRMSFNALNGNVSREGNVDNTQNIISFCTGYGGLELGIRRGSKDRGRNTREGQDTSGGSEDTQWPARPGEEQYEWEEPRVVGNTEVKGCRGMVHEQGERGDKKGRHTNGSSNEKENLGQAEPFMGGESNGTQHRVDRLRLLGNGVVPQTAELAWKTLWKELNATCHQK